MIPGAVVPTSVLVRWAGTDVTEWMSEAEWSRFSPEDGEVDVVAVSVVVEVPSGVVANAEWRTQLAETLRAYYPRMTGWETLDEEGRADGLSEFVLDLV